MLCPCVGKEIDAIHHASSGPCLCDKEVHILLFEKEKKGKKKPHARESPCEADFARIKQVKHKMTLTPLTLHTYKCISWITLSA